MKIHPAADAFPMMSDVELSDLAADIAEHGLRDPVVMLDGVLLDGRNRWEACKRAQVTPRTREFGDDPGDGSDPVAFVLSKNLGRREMTAGQRALVAAGLLNFSTQAEAASAFGISRQHIGFAQLIREWNPEAVEAVLAGEPFDQAYQIAKDAKEKHKRTEALPPHLAALVKADDISLLDATRRAALPDHYEKRVAAGELSIDEAETLHKRDRREHKAMIERVVVRLTGFAQGWYEATTLHRHEHRDEVLDAMDETDRTTLLAAETHLPKE